MAPSRLTTVKVSSRGRLYLDWTPMPRVPDEYLECVVYMYPSIPAADAGEKVGGTGFMVGVDEDDVSFFYVVTNKHVVDAGHSTVRFNTPNDKHEALEFDERNWFRSKDSDLAIYQIVSPDPLRHWFHAVGPGQFMNTDRIENLKIGIGDEVFFAGRFINAEGKDRNRPSLRFGTIAQTGTDIIDGEESFLVEARSIPGYSGSPVFSYTVAGTPRNILSQGLSAQGFGPFLLGVDWSHINDYVDAKDEHGNKLSFKIRSNSGMMGVVPAWKLHDLLFRKDVMDARKNTPKVSRAATPTGSDGAASRDVAVAPKAKGPNPHHREDFTSLLGAATQKQQPDD